MGVFKVNNVDILNIAEIIETSDAGKRKSSKAFSSGKLNISGLSDSDKTLANAPYGDYPNWGFHNIVGNKLKVNGVQDTVAAKGTRPSFYNHHYDAFAKSGTATFTITYDKDTNSLVGGTYTLSSASVLLFCLVGGGGGGGAGGCSIWGAAHGGGGGGGGASIYGMLDFNNMPGNSVTVYIGACGEGGTSEGDGTDGEASYINDGNGNRICTCGGGSGGIGDHRDHDGGSGGSGGTVSCIADCSYFRCFGKQNGAAGGAHAANGTSCAAMSVTTPDDITCVTYATSGGEQGGTATYDGGGGGASGTFMYSPAWSGGHGGARDDNSGILYGLLGGGGGGGGSRGAISASESFAGRYGGYGYLLTYYDKDHQTVYSGVY